MKIKQKTNKAYLKPLIAICAVVLALVVLYLLVARVNGLFPFMQATTQPAESSNTTTNNVNYDKPTDEQIQAGVDQKRETTSSDDSTTTGDVSVTISAKNETATAFQVHSLIGEVTNEGQCTLTMTHGAATITKTSAIQALPSSSTCKGFDVDLSELTSGDWAINILVEIGSRKGNASTTYVIE